jgi:hypothetical protein
MMGITVTTMTMMMMTMMPLNARCGSDFQIPFFTRVVTLTIPVLVPL